MGLYFTDKVIGNHSSNHTKTFLYFIQGTLRKKKRMNTEEIV